MRARETTVFERVVEILHDVAKVPAEKITADQRIEEDLDIDSLSMVEIAVVAEGRFAVSVPDDRAAEFVTVADLVGFIEAALAADSR